MSSVSSQRMLFIILYRSVYLFAGDLGGLFGLFLGGSAISIFEIIDLVIYYSLVKLFSPAQRVRPSHVNHTRPSRVDSFVPSSSHSNLKTPRAPAKFVEVEGIVEVETGKL
jgi:Amiloride-sensitive sodium channel